MDSEEVADKVWEQYSGRLNRKTIGIDVSLKEIVGMIDEVDRNG